MGTIPLPAAADGPQSLTAYVRPHNVDLSRVLNGVPALPVRVTHINAAGSIARLDLVRIDTGEKLFAEIPRADHTRLALAVGDQAFAKFKKIQIFPS